MVELRPYQKKAIDDLENSFRQGKTSPCLVLPCGSGKSVIAARIIERANSKGNHVLFLVHRKELVEQMKDTFKSFNLDENLYEIGMIQTITRHLPKYREPDLIITDEGHHGVANSYKRVYDFFQDTKLISLTATPIRLKGGGLGDINDTLIEGPSVDELIAWGNLAPFKYYAPKLVDTDKLRIRAGDYVKKDIDELFNNKVYGDVIGHYNRLSKGKKAIVYCSGIKQSKEVERIFNDEGIAAKHIDGKTNQAERDQAISDFRDGKIMVLTNVDLISEGFDIPDCNTTILLRPTKSLGLYIQQSMRSMRYQEDKTAIIIDHVGNVNRFGLPNMVREWSLDSKEGSNVTELQENPVKQCPECFSTLPSNYQRCECGYEFKEEEREIEIIEDAELEEITNNPAFTVNTKGLEFNSPDECKTVEDLKAFAKSRNYKPGWVFFQQKQRGWL